MSRSPWLSKVNLLGLSSTATKMNPLRSVYHHMLDSIFDTCVVFSNKQMFPMNTPPSMLGGCTSKRLEKKRCGNGLPISQELHVWLVQSCLADTCEAPPFRSKKPGKLFETFLTRHRHCLEDGLFEVGDNKAGRLFRPIYFSPSKIRMQLCITFSPLARGRINVGRPNNGQHGRKQVQAARRSQIIQI